MLPWIYWQAMLQGREWLAQPKILPMTPAPHEALPACEPRDARKAS
jgi:sulfide:quinone oxidoreductase